MPDPGPRPSTGGRASLACAALLGVFPALAVQAAPAPEARYRVTFQATWSAESHPSQFPAGAHFSPLIGGTHSAAATFWREGELASPGIENMAELGSTAPLDSEIESSASSEHVLRGSGTGSPGSTSLEFTISTGFPRVTLVTMIAPSPDWFTGIAGVDLLEGGDWTPSKVVALHPFDAGTDSGASYSSPDAPTEPPLPIAGITSGPLGNGAPVGTFRFDRLEPEVIPSLPLLWLPIALLVMGGTLMRVAPRSRWEKPWRT